MRRRVEPIGDLEQTQTRYSLTPASLYRMKLDYFRFFDDIPTSFPNSFVATILLNYLYYRRDSDCNTFEREMEEVLKKKRDKTIEKEIPTPEIFTFSKPLDQSLNSFSFYDRVVVEKRLFVEYVLESYFEMSSSLREKIFFYERYQVIRECIQKHQILKIAVPNADGTVLKIEYQPYLLDADENSHFYYLGGLSRLCNSDSEYQIFATKLQRIQNVCNTKKAFDYNMKYENELKKRVARFGIAHLNQSQYEKIKVALTADGYNRFTKVIVHQRPLPTKVEQRENQAYPYLLTFQCSAVQIMSYFFQFADAVEIVEPLSLRKQFADKYQNAANLYR